MKNKKYQIGAEYNRFNTTYYLLRLLHNSDKYKSDCLAYFDQNYKLINELTTNSEYKISNIESSTKELRLYPYTSYDFSKVQNLGDVRVEKPRTFLINHLPFITPSTIDNIIAL